MWRELMAKKKKKPYLPNNWKAIRDTQAEYFEDPEKPLTFDEFMEWKLGGFELPSSHVCIIRTMNINTGKVKEYAYKRPKAAKNKLVKLMERGDLEFTICDEDNVHLLTPKVDYK